jgi:hypothetical protein
MTGRPTDLMLRVERVLPAPRALIFKLYSLFAAEPEDIHLVCSLK